MSVEPPAEADATEALEDLQAQVELLEEENRRLRTTYSRLKRARHRRTAAGLAAIGLLALGAGVLFPAARTVLLVLAATGLFGGLLTWYLTPERFVAAEVGERVYAALAANGAALTDELGLSDHPRYVPVPDDPDREAVLYLPQVDADELPDLEALARTFVVPEGSASRGVALTPTGGPLLAELREATPGGLGGDPGTVTDQLVDGLREQFELVDGARREVRPADGRASVSITGSAYGAVDRFDHPVPSVFATGLAVGLGTPVEIEVDRTPDGRGEYLVTARWDSPEADESSSDDVDETGTQ